ncbi:THAP domain-containing protein 1-like [Dermacentor variabilis]|uniref:THAP domain-containing protein 1-like n=1 Tax=Dermacentor variabilis TaxID=34621 RepID=UPI003F5BEAD4
MVHFCCVPECHQEGYRCKSGEKVSFPEFPRDKVMFKKWIIAIRRDPGPNFVVGQFTRICSKDFKPDDYIPNVASGRRFLKVNAVPTQFVFAKPVKQRRPPKEQALRCSKSLTSHLLKQ